MALWSQTPRGIVNAMESAIAPRAATTAALKDKVFHANIQIESVEDAPRRDSEASGESRLTATSASAPEDVAQRERNAEMQMWWDEAIGRNMDLPDGYSKVAVLLVKWDDELDELKTRAEVCDIPTLTYLQSILISIGRRTRSRIPRAIPFRH